jgi:arsenate reductase (thioredoxin)
MKILFLCTGNSCRSQMAEGFARRLGGKEFEIYSAGAAPVAVHPMAVEVMSERGVDISDHRSKSLKEIKAVPDVVITLCGEPGETCATYPGTKMIHWPLRDPAGARGSRKAVLKVFREVRDEIEARVKDLLGQF